MLNGGTVLVNREPEPLVFGLVLPREPLDVTKTYRDTTPEFFLALPNDQKLALANEVRAFWHSLSYERVRWLNPDRDRSYVISHFQEVSPASRQALLDFIAELPADDAERKARLDYIEYWNSDSTKTYRMGGSIFSIWFHVKDPTEMALVHSGVLVLILLFTAGPLHSALRRSSCGWPRVSYIHRTQQVLFGMDTMMNILLFYLMIGNSGAALSLDRLDRALPRGPGQPAPFGHARREHPSLPRLPAAVDERRVRHCGSFRSTSASSTQPRAFPN